MGEEQRVERLVEQIVQGRLTRREALRRAAALGLSLPAAMALVTRAAAQQASPVAIPEPPVADVIPTTLELDGISLEDPYAWLENPDDPAVIAYLEAENAYADAMMAPTAALQQTLYDEMLGRLKETDTSPPRSTTTSITSAPRRGCPTGSFAAARAAWRPRRRCCSI